MTTEPEIKNAFDIMRNNRVSLFNAGEMELAAREALRAAEARIINEHDPKALGGNEAARNAKIRELTKTERADLEEAEKERREAQLAFELSGMRVDCLKWQIRNDQAIAALAEAGIHG